MCTRVPWHAARAQYTSNTNACALTSSAPGSLSQPRNSQGHSYSCAPSFSKGAISLECAA
eukprot:13400321-Alexandrium_andersonii.AAC.1